MREFRGSRRTGDRTRLPYAFAIESSPAPGGASRRRHQGRVGGQGLDSSTLRAVSAAWTVGVGTTRRVESPSSHCQQLSRETHTTNPTAKGMSVSSTAEAATLGIEASGTATTDSNL